jgi:uncharacterized protein (TIGR02145 family)/prepilin-type N-terminal cleavage/methylation domain-containing protein
MLKRASNKLATKQKAFTLVELMAVIVIIGILATVIFVSYTGMTSKATDATVTTDIKNGMEQIKLYFAEHGSYPTRVDDCPTPASSNLCLATAKGNVFDYYVADNSSTPKTFYLSIKNGNTQYSITNTSTSPEAYSPPTVTIGSGAQAQVWMAKNVDNGTKIDSSINQDANNSIVEKYCYNDDISYCNSHGGLYTPGEAAQGTMSEGIRGVCPQNFHIPTDAEFQQLETNLGMANPNTSGWRNAPGIANQLVTGPFKAKIPGYFWGANSFEYIDFTGGYYTSTPAYMGPWTRVFDGPTSANFGRFEGTAMAGGVLAVRCIQD